MTEHGFFTRYALLLCVVFLAAGCYGLAMAHGRVAGPDFKGLIHVSTALVLLAGVALMFRAEAQA